MMSTVELLTKNGTVRFSVESNNFELKETNFHLTTINIPPTSQLRKLIFWQQKMSTKCCDF